MGEVSASAIKGCFVCFGTRGGRDNRVMLGLLASVQVVATLQRDVSSAKAARRGGSTSLQDVVMYGQAGSSASAPTARAKEESEAVRELRERVEQLEMDKVGL